MQPTAHVGLSQIVHPEVISVKRKTYDRNSLRLMTTFASRPLECKVKPGLCVELGECRMVSRGSTCRDTNTYFKLTAFIISPNRLPNQVILPVWQHIACSGNMNLCVEFDNLILNASMETKLSLAGCFPFAHSFITIF